MIITVVTFDLPSRWTEEEATKAFVSTAPNYVQASGLIRKHYCLSEDGNRTVGIYVWRSRTDAERCHDSKWAARVKSTYGTEPRLQFLSALVSIDRGEINVHPSEALQT